MQFSYKLENGIRKGRIILAHGEIKTPVFMPVGTIGSVKGISPQELKEINAQIILGNTYHLYLRPGEDFLKEVGGLHKFINWDQPLLTDSGGFQVFSLGARRGILNGNTENELIDDKFTGGVKITEDGVIFKSHLDGSENVFTPESVIDTQIKFGSDIMMVLDVCTEYPATWERAKETMELTHRWAKRAIDHFRKLQKQGIGKNQNLFGIIQGSTYEDLRIESAKTISTMGFDGIAIGGVSVGEGKKNMADVLDWVMPYIPEDKPRYLMGVGEPEDLIMATQKGIDMFDCVLPTRLGRHGTVWVKVEDKKYKKIDLRKSVYQKNTASIDEKCNCFACKNQFSQAYISHLIREKEIFGLRLASLHNLYTLLDLMKEIRKS